MHLCTEPLLACCRVGCPALKVPADLMVTHEGLVFAAMDAMRPSDRLLDIIHMCVRYTSAVIPAALLLEDGGMASEAACCRCAGLGATWKA